MILNKLELKFLRYCLETHPVISDKNNDNYINLLKKLNDELYSNEIEEFPLKYLNEIFNEKN